MHLCGSSTTYEQLIPDKARIIEELAIWVEDTYAATPQSQMASQILNSKIRKIHQKVLCGSTVDFLFHYKWKIKYLVDSVYLQNECNLCFEREFLKALETCEYKREIKIHKKQKLELEKKEKALQWENFVLAELNVEDQKINFTDSHLSETEELLLKQEAKLKLDSQFLIGQINFNSRKFEKLNEKISVAEQAVDRSFKETLQIENELQVHQALCLQTIKKYQNEIDECINALKLEPNRVKTELKSLESEHLTNVKLAKSNFEFQLRKEVEKQYQAIMAKQSDYVHKVQVEKSNFKNEKNKIQNEYNSMSQQNYEFYSREKKKNNEAFDREVILTRKDFKNKRFKNSSYFDEANIENFYDGKMPQPAQTYSESSSQKTAQKTESTAQKNTKKLESNKKSRIDNLRDYDPITLAIFQERDRELSSLNRASKKSFSKTTKKVSKTEEFCQGQFIEYSNTKKIESQNKIFSDWKQALEQEIEKKLEDLLGREK